MTRMLADPDSWAREQCGRAESGDRRHTPHAARGAAGGGGAAAATEALARPKPRRPASSVVWAEHVRVLAAYLHRAPQGWTVRDFWRAVAQPGGLPARPSDGELGWQTVWRGWRELDLMTLGARRAAKANKCG